MPRLPEPRSVRHSVPFGRQHRPGGPGRHHRTTKPVPTSRLGGTATNLAARASTEKTAYARTAAGGFGSQPLPECLLHGERHYEKLI